MERINLTQWLDEALNLSAFAADHSNNGLQAEGSENVSLAVFGVDGCQSLFDRAAELGAQFVFVHHGLSWGGEPRRLAGITGKRFGTLFRNNINFYAAHLPLDAHPVFGNNAVLCDMAKVTDRRPFFHYDGICIGWQGLLEEPTDRHTISTMFAKALNCTPMHGGPDDGRIIRKIAVVSGGGGLESLEEAAESGADLLLTGELTHIMYHHAVELDVQVLALGHYASETTGPQALMREIQKRFGIDCRFVDIPTGL